MYNTPYLLKIVYYSGTIVVMFKKWLLLIALIFGLPAFSGEVENALDKGNNVFLYLTSAKCKYCVAFNPIYNRLLQKHNGEFSFFKVDSSSKYGRGLMLEYSAYYVPYVVLLNKPKKKGIHIPPPCLMDDVCLESALKDFRS